MSDPNELLYKSDELIVTMIDEKTGKEVEIGTVTSEGELNVEKFIEIAMSLPSFWEIYSLLLSQ